MKICRSCREEFKDKVTKCIYCGGPLETVSASALQQRTLDEPDKKEKSGTEPREIWKYYKIPIITIIVLIAGIMFVVLQKADFNKSAKQTTGTESLRIHASVAPVPEPASTPEPDAELKPATEPKPAALTAAVINLYNEALSLCSGEKCTNPQKAIELLTEVVSLQPDFENAYSARGNAYSHLKEYQTALDDYNKAIQLKPDNSFFFNNRGNVYNDLKQYQQALEDYNTAIQLKPNNSFFFNNRGNVYNDLNQYKQAIEDYNEAIRLKPDDATAYHNRGNAYFIRGDVETGCRDAQKACELGNCKLSEFGKEKKYCR